MSQTDSSLNTWHDSSNDKQIVDLPVDSVLHSQFVDAAWGIAFRFRKIDRRLPEIHSDITGFSIADFVDSRSARKNVRSRYKSDVVDGTSAAVIYAAHIAGVPAVAIGNSLPGNTDDAYNVTLAIQQFLEREL